MTTLCAGLNRQQSCRLYAEVLASKDAEALRRLMREDLFALLVVGCKRKDINRDWLYDRCREVEADPDGRLDLWAREHYKSTLITFGMTVKDILTDPEVTVGIFSHTRPIAKKFLGQLKEELEKNEFLKDLFPDVLWREPHKQAPSWSLDNGITVRRQSNPKEKTIEAWGLVDGQPIGAHFSRLVYDDVVTRESITTPEQIEKTTEAWALSLNLGAHGGKRRYIGTRYHFNDTYRTLMERNAARPRIYAATQDGTPTGAPRFLTAESLAEKREQMGPYVFACQMLQNPVADNAQGFKEDWLRYWEERVGDVGGVPRILNKYLLVDPAGEKKKENDYTVMAVIGLAPDQNYYLIEAIRDRLNLTERTEKVFDFHRRHKLMCVGYEKYGMQSDIEHVKYVMEQRQYRFPIRELGGPMPKNDRIRRLIPVFEQGRFWMPRRILFKDAEGQPRDFILELLRDEYSAFPVAVHDDMLDCLARIVDPGLGAQFPLPTPVKPVTVANGKYKIL